MMTKKLILLCVALAWTASLMAQEISVVDTNGNTQLFTTLADAINGASDGSTIYIPGGRFAIANEVKITKKLTIIGIGHYINNEENEDGRTIIEGNLWLNDGSSGSAVMGCYITGDINIGDDGASVNDVVIRYCHSYRVSIKNSTCLGAIINQNYITYVQCPTADVFITNNIATAILYVQSGVIKNNVICGYEDALYGVCNSVIANNVIRSNYRLNRNGSGNDITCNYVVGSSWGDDPIVIDANVEDVFNNFNNWQINPTSNFHFKDDYKEYESQVGIYAGTGFNDKQLAPVPYIVAKEIGTETDASGKLNIKIRVKAGE